MPSPQDLPATTSPAGTPQAPRKVDLRGKKKRFADAFRLNFNIIEAAKAADAPFGKEREFGLKMLEDPKVSSYLSSQQTDEQNIPRPSQLRVLDEMAAIAFSSLGDAMEVHESGDKKGELRRLRLDRIDPRTIQQFTVRQHQHGTDVTVKTHPKVDTLKQLSQVNGLMADDGAPIPRVPVLIVGSNVQINNGGGGQ